MEYNFIVKESEFPAEWECFCVEYPQLSIVWTEHAYNATNHPKKAPIPMPDGLDAAGVASVMRQMGEFLGEYYYDLCF